MYQTKLMFKRREFQITFFIMMLISIFAFLICCYQNYGLDYSMVLAADKNFILRDMGSDFLLVLVYSLPVFVVLPFADSFYTDKTENIATLVLMRTGAKDYFFSKLKTVALSSFLVTFVPFFVNYILCLIAFPLTSISFMHKSASSEQITFYSNRTLNKILFPKLFVEHPYIYNFVFLIMLTVFLMLCAVLIYELSYYCLNKGRLFILAGLFVANDILVILSNTPIIGDFLSFAPNTYLTAYDVTEGKSVIYLIFMFLTVFILDICLIPGCLSRLKGKDIK